MVQSTTGLTRDQAGRLRDAFAGEIVTPGDTSYDDARRLWNAVHDRRPAVIVRPGRLRRSRRRSGSRASEDLELAVRSGGHSPAGHSRLQRRPRRRPVGDARRVGRSRRRAPHG